MTTGRDFIVAAMFLTRLTIRSSRPWEKDDLASSVLMFPVIGALLGLMAAGVHALGSAIDLPPFLAAAITIAFLVLVTGALHEDGLADIADGLGGGRTRDDKLRIMRDSTLGSYGVLALVFGLLLRIGAVAALSPPMVVGGALIASSALSRAAMPLAMTVMSQARRDGLAARAGRPHPGRAAASALIAILITSLCLPWYQAMTLIALTCLVSFLFLRLAQRQIGGITGDILGALQQIVDIVSLLALVCLTTGT